MIPDGIQDSLDVFDQITKSFGQLGAVGPLAIAALLLTRQDQTNDAVNKATSEAMERSALLAKDLKAISDSLSKDLKATEASFEERSALFLKTIEATEASIEESSALLSKTIEANAAAITNNTARGTNWE